MSCQRYRHAIVDHAFGADLDPGAAAHLESCPACLEAFDEQRRLIGELDDRLQAAVAIDHSPRFVAATLARIESSPRTVHWWQARWAIPAAAALAAIAIAAAIPFRSGDAPLSTPPPRVDARVPEPAPPASGRSPVVTPPPAVVVKDAGRRPASTEQRPVAAGVSKPAPLEAPVVIVPAAASQAVRDYMTMVRRGRFAVAEAEAEPRERASGLAADLTIDSLSVQSLDLAAMDEINPPDAGKPRPDAAAEPNAANEER